MPSTSKLIGIALTGTGVVGAGAGTYYALGSNSQTPEKKPAPVIKSKISDLITLSKRTVLTDTATSDDWGIKLDVYNKSKNKVTLSSINEAGLKEWCTKTTKKDIEISKKDKENSDFKIALKLCTKPTNREKIEKGTKTIAEQGDWSKIEKNYRGESTNSFVILGISEKAQAKGEEIKEWCNKTLDEEIKASGNTHELTEKWCTKPAS